MWHRYRKKMGKLDGEMKRTSRPAEVTLTNIFFIDGNARQPSRNTLSDTSVASRRADAMCESINKRSSAVINAAKTGTRIPVEKVFFSRQYDMYIFYVTKKLETTRSETNERTMERCRFATRGFCHKSTPVFAGIESRRIKRDRYLIHSVIPFNSMSLFRSWSEIKFELNPTDSVRIARIDRVCRPEHIYLLVSNDGVFWICSL